MTETPNILIIDDDNQIRDLLQKFLQKQGWHIANASNAEQARENSKNYKARLNYT